MATATHDHDDALTIGVVRERLADEFPDISISKIRYLEGQGLLSPRRTQSGYRLYSDDDVERLGTILRLQRDEFLPLRVIREELVRAGRPPQAPGASAAPATGCSPRRSRAIDLRTLCERGDRRARRSSASSRSSGSSSRQIEDGEPRYHERDVELVAACARLARFGIEPRNLRSLPERRLVGGRAPGADRRARAPLPEPGAAARRARGPRDARRRLAGALPAALLARAPVAGDVVRLSSVAHGRERRPRAKIRDIPDFPKPGIVFKDIMPLLADPDAFRAAVEGLAEFAAPRKPDLVMGAEARGFILGGALALELGCGFVAARKPGKLPWDDRERRVRARVRRRLARAPRRRDRRGRARPHPRRPARHGRHGEGQDRPRRAARRARSSASRS